MTVAINVIGCVVILGVMVLFLLMGLQPRGVDRTAKRQPFSPPQPASDTARAHLQAIVTAYDTGTKTELEDAVHHAAIYLKGGI